MATAVPVASPDRAVQDATTGKDPAEYPQEVVDRVSAQTPESLLERHPEFLRALCKKFGALEEFDFVMQTTLQAWTPAKVFETFVQDDPAVDGKPAVEAARMANIKGSVRATASANYHTADREFTWADLEASRKDVLRLLKDTVRNGKNNPGDGTAGVLYAYRVFGVLP